MGLWLGMVLSKLRFKNTRVGVRIKLFCQNLLVYNVQYIEISKIILSESVLQYCISKFEIVVFSPCHTMTVLSW